MQHLPDQSVSLCLSIAMSTSNHSSFGEQIKANSTLQAMQQMRRADGSSLQMAELLHRPEQLQVGSSNVLGEQFDSCAGV